MSDAAPCEPVPPTRVRLDLVTSLSLAVAVAAIAIGAREHAFFFGRWAGPVGFDEGYVAAVGERMIDGRWLPYVDGVSHRGPLLYWTVALSERLVGRWSWMSIRGLAFAAMALTCLSAWVAGWAARRPVAGALAAVVYVYAITFGFPTDYGMALNGEQLATPFAVAAVALLLVGIERASTRSSRSAWLFAAGACAALAGLTKQTLLPAIGPIALAAWAGASDEVDAGRARRARVGWVLAGWAAPILATVAIYAAARQLGALWYWTFRYNAEVYMAPYRSADLRREIGGWLGREPWAALAIVLAIATAVAAPWAAARGRGVAAIRSALAADPLDWAAGLLALLSLAAALAALRFWAHYFVPVVPWVGLVAGGRADRLVRRGGPMGSPLAAAVLLGLSCAFVAFCVDQRLAAMQRDRRNGGWQAAEPEPVCAAVDAHSAPGERIFVWGFDGDLYVTCRRTPASRFAYLTLVAGIVPPFWNDVRPERRAEGALPALLEDLKSARPPLVLDVPSRMGNVSMRALPDLARFLDEDYCRLPTIDSRYGRKATPWVRRDRYTCPAGGAP